jgi:hypothetical protein
LLAVSVAGIYLGLDRRASTGFACEPVDTAVPDEDALPADIHAAQRGIWSERRTVTREREYVLAGTTMRRVTTWDIYDVKDRQLGTTTTPDGVTWDLYTDFSEGGRWYTRKSGEKDWLDSGPSNGIKRPSQGRWNCPSQRATEIAPGRYQLNYTSRVSQSVTSIEVQLEVDASSLRPLRRIARWRETYLQDGKDVVQQLTQTVIFTDYNTVFALPADLPRASD